MKNKRLSLLLVATTAICSANIVFAQDVPADVAAETPTGTDAAAPAATTEVVVTARRRSEKLQTVPAAITALSTAALERSSVQTLQDVRTLVPGLTFASEGGSANTSLSLRGIGQIATGVSVPGVVTYINDVAIPSIGSNSPTFDLANVQVLKGPQGTLFGKNTLGGAVLVNSVLPGEWLEGYVKGTYGRFDYSEFEGAITVPMGEKASLRVAGQVRRQDARTEALDAPAGGGSYPGFDDIKQDSARVSLRLEPTDKLKNITVVDYFKADELPGSLYLQSQNYSVAALGFPSFLADQLDPQIAAARAANAADPRKSFDGGINGGESYRRSVGVVNTTTYALSDTFTVRNILGYREVLVRQLINTGGVPQMSLTIPTGLPAPAPALVDIPFTLFYAGQTQDRAYFSDELQFLGDYDWGTTLFGVYYSKESPNGPSGTQSTIFSVGGMPANPTTSHVEVESVSAFAQVGVKLTPKLTANIGYRYSWDDIKACGGYVPVASGLYADYDACKAAAEQNDPDDGIGKLGTSGSAPTWTVGLDYKPTQDLLLYAVTRRGYRNGNVNTPLFETAFTTGGTSGCLSPTGACPDLTPYQTYKKETLTDIELGEKYTFRSGELRGRINTAIFYSKYKNAVQFITTASLGIPQTATDAPTNSSIGVNAADLSVSGIEVEASVSPVPSLTFTLNAAATRVEVDEITIPEGLSFSEAQITRYSPDFSGTFSASWTLPYRPDNSEFVLNADIFTTEKFGGQAGLPMPGYTIANARLDWKNVGNSGIDLGVYVRNLTDEEYAASPAVIDPAFPIGTVYLAEPKTYGVTVMRRF